MSPLGQLNNTTISFGKRQLPIENPSHFYVEPDRNQVNVTWQTSGKPSYYIVYRILTESEDETSTLVDSLFKLGIPSLYAVNTIHIDYSLNRFTITCGLNNEKQAELFRSRIAERFFPKEEFECERINHQEIDVAGARHVKITSKIADISVQSKRIIECLVALHKHISGGITNKITLSPQRVCHEIGDGFQEGPLELSNNPKADELRVFEIGEEIWRITDGTIYVPAARTPCTVQEIPQGTKYLEPVLDRRFGTK